jgi:thiazole/oxazole-forming peptide maturase SagD family component
MRRLPLKAPALADPLWNALTTPCAGPVVAVQEWRVGVRSPLWCCALACSAIDRAHDTVRTLTGAGREMTLAAARRKAAFEVVERLAFFESPFPATGRIDAPVSCPLDAYHVKGHDLTSGERVSSVASNVFGHPRGCYWSSRPDRPSSNGYAAGESVADATARAVLELIERDALMTAWRTKSVLPTLQPQDFGLEAALRRTDDRGLRATFVDMSSTRHVPATICVLRGPGPDELPITTIGSAADVEIDRAMRRALIEAESVHAMCAQRVMDVGRSSPDFVEFSANAFQYLDPSRLADLDFLDAGPLRAPSVEPLQATGEQLVNQLAKRLAAQRVTVHVFDVTPSWATDFGVHVAAARSEDLYPLELGRGDGALANRMAERAQAARSIPASINLEPVPLA